MKPEFVRNPYNYDSDKESRDTGLACKDKSLAQQQFKEESDINFIADRFKLTGEMPQLTDGFEWGANFDAIFDYQTAQNAIVAGNNAFMALPAKLRARFQNDPQLLMDFLEDRDNEQEARKLGLLKPLPEPVQDLRQSPQGDAAGTDGDNPAPKGQKPAAKPATAGKSDT